MTLRRPSLPSLPPVPLSRLDISTHTPIVSCVPMLLIPALSSPSPTPQPRPTQRASAEARDHAVQRHDVGVTVAAFNTTQHNTRNDP